MTSDPNTTDDTSVTSQNLTLEEVNDEMAETLLPAMIYVGVLMIVGVVGNGIVCYVFCRKMPKGTQNFLVVCLAVFDLLNCTVAMPTEIVDMRQSYTFESETACKILRFVNVFTAIGSIFTLLVIAVDRYKNVLHPFQRQMSLRSAHRSLAFILIGALTFSWPALVLYGIRHADVGIPGVYGRDCSTRDAARETAYPLIYNIVQFVGFVSITVVLFITYVRILRETRRHYRYLRDNTDFYYVSGSVARSEGSPKIALISDSRLNLQDYFVREVNMCHCLGHRYEGIDNPGLDLEELEDRRSTSSKEHKRHTRGKKSPVLSAENHTPIMLRRFHGGRSTGKYFISRHSEDVLTSKVSKQEELACKKSESAPNITDVLVKKEICLRDIQSEGKPTPVAKRRFFKRQVSSNSLGKKSPLRSRIISNGVRSVSKQVCYSDGDVRWVTSLTPHDILAKEQPGFTVKAGAMMNQNSSSPFRKRRSPRSFLQMKFPGKEQKVNQECIAETNTSADFERADTIHSLELNDDIGKRKCVKSRDDVHQSNAQLSKDTVGDSSSELVLKNQNCAPVASPSCDMLEDSSQQYRKCDKTGEEVSDNSIQQQKCDGIQRDDVECDSIQCDGVQREDVKRDGVQCEDGGLESMEREDVGRDDVHREGLECDIIQCEDVRRDGVQCEGLGRESEEHNGVQRESLECGVVQREDAGRDVVQREDVEYDDVQHDVLDGDAQHNEPEIAHNNPEEVDSSPGAAVSFFVPQCDEGIDMTFEVEDATSQDGVLALCPQCRSQYYLQNYVSNSNEVSANESQGDMLEPNSLSDILKQQNSLDDYSGHGSELQNSNLTEDIICEEGQNMPSIDKAPPEVLLTFSLAGDLESCDTSSIATAKSFPEKGVHNSSEHSHAQKSLSESDGRSNLRDRPTESKPDLQSTFHRQESFVSISSTEITHSAPGSGTELPGGTFERSRNLIPQISQSEESNGDDWPDQSLSTSVKVGPASKPSSATSIAISVTAVFILSFLPHLSLMLARVLKPNFDYELTGSSLVLYNIFLRSYLVNSALNCFVYGFLNQQFRDHCRQILHSSCICRD